MSSAEGVEPTPTARRERRANAQSCGAGMTDPAAIAGTCRHDRAALNSCEVDAAPPKEPGPHRRASSRARRRHTRDVRQAPFRRLGLRPCVVKTAANANAPRTAPNERRIERNAGCSCAARCESDGAPGVASHAVAAADGEAAEPPDPAPGPAGDDRVAGVPAGSFWFRVDPEAQAPEDPHEHAGAGTSPESRRCAGAGRDQRHLAPMSPARRV
jgi:hypothetical protein